MLAKILSAAVFGLESSLVEVEVDVSSGLHSFSIVGLPDAALKEAKQRVAAAVQNIGAKSPLRANRKITINLAPADVKKYGSYYDLPIALGYLVASGQIASFNPADKIFIGELDLEGKLRPVTGTLAIALWAKKQGYKYLFLPWANIREVSVVKGIKIIGAENLKEIIAILENKQRPRSLPEYSCQSKLLTKNNLFSQIQGQEKAKRALVIAASGGHNLLFIGPPGSGKTLLARAITELLPPLSLKEAIEVTKIYSLSGLLSASEGLIFQRPFRSPHHSASLVSIIGGGSWPQPGEITLAHRGVLFLDELPEFRRDVLESLRQPLEEGKVCISRAKSKITFPAKFLLLCAMNPCPCGYYGDPEKECTCSPHEIIRYRKKISGPLIDRIDLLVKVPRLRSQQIFHPENQEVKIQNLQQQIIKVREIQEARFNHSPILTNGEMRIREVKKYCFLDPKAKTFLQRIIDKYALSMRGYHRLLKISRTIADLDNSEIIKLPHLAEALQFKINLLDIN